MIFPVLNAASVFLRILDALPVSIVNLISLSWIFGATVLIVNTFLRR